MNPNNQFKVNEKFISEFKDSCAKGNLEKAAILLEVFKPVPEELHEIALDALIKTVGISPLHFRIGLSYLTWKQDRLPLNDVNREILLSTILEVAANTERPDFNGDELHTLSDINDPRVFETLVNIYKKSVSPERNRAVTSELGRSGKEHALPILLDYIFRQIPDLSEEETHLLEKYPVVEKIDSIQVMETDDRDKVVDRFIKYLRENRDLNDDLRVLMASALTILYKSNTTSIRSRDQIKANSDIAICQGHDVMRGMDNVEYMYLKQFTNFIEDPNL